ncbi:unnamed protein product [Adineta ricciae]|uniref:C2 domain-containing protein n=1 Tax=Adineta ricciae TaxID=249248 RepID=A0A815RCQ5_ADIRI|nr:unnamed protein product [Adineta ricciae]
MSGESTDSECTSAENSFRSRSLLRHVRNKLARKSFNRHHTQTATDRSLSVALIRTSHRSFDYAEIEKRSISKTPTSYSHRMSLLNQVRSHFTGSRKYRQTIPSDWNDDDNDDRLSFRSVHSLAEIKPSPTSEEQLSSTTNGIDSSSSDSPLSSNHKAEDGHDKTALLNGSTNMTVEENGSTDLSKTLNNSRVTLNKFKDQLTQRARTVIPKTPAIGSIFNNSTPTTPTDNEPDEAYWTEICIERGANLCVKDIGGSSDPYVKVVYGTEEKYTTQTVSKSLNPVWNEKFSIFTNDLNLPLYFHVYDHDRIGRDESMGTAKIELWKLPFERLYGANLELEGEDRSDNKNGTLKVSITITPKSLEFHDEVLRNIAKQSQVKSFFGGRSGNNSGVVVPRRTIDVFVIEGRNLKSRNPDGFCSPFVRLKYGNKKSRTQTIKYTRSPVWHQSFMYDTYVGELPPIEIAVFDDASSSGDFIGRGLCNLAHLNEERTHRIPVDLEDGAGIVDLFVTITQTTALQEATNDGDSASNIPLDAMPSRLKPEDANRYTFLQTFKNMNPILDVGKLEIKIFQARDLSAKDIIGKSDPFCIVELDSSRLRTHTIYKTLDPVWNKSFIMPCQDIHSVVELTIYDEDSNGDNEFIGKVAIPLLTIQNGQKKWMQLKDRKCLLPVKGAIEIEASFFYSNLKAVIRTINPRQVAYYQMDNKFSIGAIKQHLARITNMLSGVINVMKFINHCFQWDNPWLSFGTFMVTLIIVWNFELYMLPAALLLILARNFLNEYRRGRIGKAYAPIENETIAALVQPAPVIEEELPDAELSAKEPKKSFMGVISGIQDTVLEIQGYIDDVASTLERVKNLFNYSVPWLSTLLIIILVLVSVLLYYVPLRALILAFVINKFTKRFRKPKGFIDNNELADFFSRLPSDPELVRYRELKVIQRAGTQKKSKPSKK